MSAEAVRCLALFKHGADQEIYQVAEQEARRQRIGLWRDANLTAPWDWRHGEPVVQNQECECASGTTCVGPKGGIYCFTATGGKKYR